MAGQTSLIAGRGAAPVLAALARGADHAASASLQSVRVDERNPALLRRVDEVMRKDRRGQAPADYDERCAGSLEPLILPGHDRGGDGTRLAAAQPTSP